MNHSPEHNDALSRRQLLLIQTNVNWLNQAYALLEDLTDEDYTASPAGMSPHKVGGHLRHILEFYECFLDGVDCAHVDYDSRRRDLSLEHCRDTALCRIASLIHELQNKRELRGDHLVFVRMEDADNAMSADPYLTSSVSRELGVLSSHTIHHFALIAMTLRLLGRAVDKNFGMAPSTLTHLAKQQQALATLEAA
jgi:uncharacterized damage-inducible protein DinB